MKKHFLLSMKHNFKSRLFIPKKTLEEIDFDSLFDHQRYFEKNNLSISPHTWHDLEMHQVYQNVNETVTSTGEETLMAMIMNPPVDLSAYKSKTDLFNRFQNTFEDVSQLRKSLFKVGYQSGDVRKVINQSLEEEKPVSNIGLKVSSLLIVSLLSFLLLNKGVPFILLSVVLFGIILYHYSWSAKHKGYVSAYAYLVENARVIVDYKDDIQVVENRDISHIVDFSYELMKHKRIFTKLDGINPLMDIGDVILLKLEREFKKVRDILNEDSSLAFEMIKIIGQLDALQSLKYYKDQNDQWIVPEMTEDGDLVAEDLINPIIESCVSNDINLEQSMVITGSNMSGKSTYLRTVGVNVLLAQGLQMAFARSYTSSFYKLVTSISLNDDMTSGKSFFMMEAESLKLMLDGIEESPTQLLLIDEILKGTNPEERLAASVVILNTLEKTEKVIVTTHDIGILEDLTEYEAFHLEHHVTDQAIVYDYDLKPGTSVYKNAIKIMTYLKYPKGLIEDINSYMFTEKGV